MFKKDLLTVEDLNREKVERIFKTAASIKSEPEEYRSLLEGRVMAMVFQKPSLRTRVTFESGMVSMGGHAIYLSDHDISLGARESIDDVARNLERWVDVIVARVFGHEIASGLADHARVPVINALSDYEHPCQALADLFTLLENWHTFEGRRLAYVGDGNNVCHSLMLLSALAGLDMTVGCPSGYEPEPRIVARAQAWAEARGTKIVVTNDAVRAVHNADAVYTDVWASMGQEGEKEHRAKVFLPFQLNAALYHTAKDDALIMHCLPAHKGEEITADVFEAERSVVFDQAENRLHVQKAVLRLVLVP